jgi:hypothetical protein
MSEEDYLEARERTPEPSSVSNDRWRFIKAPPICCIFETNPDLFMPTELDEGLFTKQLVRQGGATFYAWIANERIYF